MRTYKLTEDLIVHCKNDKDCIFCAHCTDICWDYSNGIYMIICDIGEEPFKDNCIYFKEGDNNGK